MEQILEYIKMAVDNIKSNKARSILTMIGIIIGIASVIMIISIGNGAKYMLEDQLSAVAGGQVMFYMGNDATSDDYYTQKDVEAMEEEIDHIKGILPNFSIGGSTHTQKGEFSVILSGGIPNNETTTKKEIVDGKYYTRADLDGRRLVGVISEADAKKVFGTSDVVGMTIEVNVDNILKDVIIVGVTKSEENSMFSYTGDSITLDVPYLSMENFGYWMDNFYSLTVYVDNTEYIPTITEKSLALLERRHQNEGRNCYTVEDLGQSISAITNVLDMITIFISFVAAISLLVGGIGVMNIMLVSVTERTREIGIRKALGAKTSSIMYQFIIESAIITAIGGIIGIILGILSAKLVGVLIGAMMQSSFTPRTSIGAIVIATVFSSFVGIFFGMYPAKKAAKLNPIEALRRS